MVVDAINYHFFDFWSINLFYKWIGAGTFYLYFILMSREKALETIIVLALVSLIVSLWRDINWLIYVSIGFLVVALASKKLTNLIGKGWFGFSHYFGIVMNHIILFIIFFLFLFPLSQLQKLMGRKQSKDDTSYFHKRNHRFTVKDVERPW